MVTTTRKLLLAALATAVLALPTSAGAAVAQPADSFVDSIGVNTHLYYSDTAYAQSFSTVEQRLRELGVRHIRENLVPNRPDQYERLNQLAAQGIRSTLILGDPDDGGAGLAKLTSILGSDLRGSVDAVEGPNEWDLNGPSNWMSGLAPYQGQIYSAIKNSSLSGIPVVGPSLGNTNSDGSDVSGSLDYGNIHSYPNGEPPEWNLADRLNEAKAMSGSKPVMATETGYHTAVNFTGDHRPTSEAAEATYLPRLFLEYYGQGVARTFSYELLDEFSDPGHQEAESNFGLLRQDLSPKPAFVALRNLISILSDPGASFKPGKLDYAISGDQDELHQLLLQKSDGSYYLALWRAESVWDNDRLSAESAAAGTVKVAFGAGVASAEEFAPNASNQPLRTLSANGGEVSVNVGAQVTILRVGSDGGGLSRIKAWLSKRAVESGEPVAVQGKLLGGGGTPQLVTIQRWRGGWKTIATSKTKASGKFKKILRLTSGPGSSRIRVISRRAKPSHPVKVRVIASKGGAPTGSISSASAL